VTRLAELEGRIGAMTELQGIVSAMRSLAGMRLREAQRALPGVRRYAGAMESAIGAAARLAPDGGLAGSTAQGGMPRAVILCTAEHGFAGGFNERILDAADRRPDDALFVLGTRGAVKAAERGWTLAWSGAMASRPDGVVAVVRQLATQVYDRIASGRVAAVAVLFTRTRTGGGATIEHRPILPLDLPALTAAAPPWAPLHNLPPAVLLERLIAEHVFSLLAEAAVESIASENAARFAAMEAAHDSLTRRVNALRAEASQARQEEITTELLDLVTGVEAQM
jgi:F-type H+-transporting ATPase subunit gamma